MALLEATLDCCTSVCETSSSDEYSEPELELETDGVAVGSSVKSCCCVWLASLLITDCSKLPLSTGATAPGALPSEASVDEFEEAWYEAEPVVDDEDV